MKSIPVQFLKMQKYFIGLIFFVVIHLIKGSDAYSQCFAPNASNMHANTLTPTTALIYLQGGHIGDLYVEYGLQGFTPGADANPGFGGTVLSLGSANADTATGLIPDTLYDYYFRLNCSGTWSANSVLVQFRTFPDCATAQVITCSSMNTISFPAGGGAWGTCSGQGVGREQVFSFTPTVSGTHVLFAPKDPTGEQAYYAYRVASSGCTNNSWICLGFTDPTGITQFSVGPLTAGVEYYIVADNAAFTVQDLQFRIECPNCPQPLNFRMISNTPTTITMAWNTSISFGYIEYGPPGFTPGTDNLPGIGGTLISVSGNSKTFSPSSSGNYDVYIREWCTTGGFSPNSTKAFVRTAQCPLSSTYGALGTYHNCEVDSGRGYWDAYNLCTSNATGKEHFMRFTPPASGAYTILVNEMSGPMPENFTLSYKVAGACDISGSICINWLDTSWSEYHYLTDFLNAGTDYDFILDELDTGSPIKYFVQIKCPDPDPPVLSNVESSSMTVTWGCDCSVSYLEYGPEGFTPGTGAMAGPNGTLIPNASSPYNLSGLTPNTVYDFYVRSNCGNQFSNNTVVSSHRTAIDCNLPTLLYLGVPESYRNIYYQKGAWQNYGCGPATNDAIEELYSFTPQVTGDYLLHVFNANSNNIGYIYTTSYYMKEPVLCVESGWTCIGDMIYTMGSYTPVKFPLGTLTAGTSYCILTDARNQGFASHSNGFRIEKPDSCLAPYISGITDITPTSFVVRTPCNGCFGDVILEYGPAGFTPGSDSTAGIGGTVILSPAFPYTISGLTPGMSYDIYARQSCSILSSFSSNTIALSVTLCLVAPSGISIASSNSVLCQGDSSMLNVNASGDPLSYRWYRNNMAIDTTTVDTFIVRDPGVYLCIAYNSCGSVGSMSTAIVEAPTVSLGSDTLICTYNSILLDAGSGAINYLWSDGSTSQTLLAFSLSPDTIDYYVLRTDTNSCESADTIQVIFDVCSEITNMVQDNNIFLFPNPTQNNLIVTLRNGWRISSIRVYDITAQLQSTSFLTGKNGEFLEVKTNALVPGIYFIEVYTENQKIVQRFIKQ
jgi:hypothetical protein